MLQLATGGGKTRMSAAIAEGALSKNNRLAFVCPRIDLIDQTVEEYYKEDIREVGVIQAQHQLTDWSKPIQVCSIDTIRNRTNYPEANVIIFDEAHILTKTHKEWMAECPDKIFIGLSATPYTRGLGKYFDTLLTVATTQELIDKGYLSPFRVYATGHPDLSEVKITAGEYNEGQLSNAMQRGSLTADIVRTWKEKWGKDKTLCFAVDCAHAKALQERFESSGVSCGYQDSRTPPDERREIKRKFHRGEYQVVTNVGTLTVGVDFDCRCLILARPTRSKALYQQIIGRALRLGEGKEYAIILDHSDTTERLGFVTDIYIDGLDDGSDKPKIERAAPLPKECPNCTALLAPGIRECPLCGYVRKAPKSGIYEQDGELAEIIPGKPLKKDALKPREWSIREKQNFLAELKGYGRERGYKDGWAANKYRDRLNEWPDKSIQNVDPTMPSPGTRSWIKSTIIAFAMRKRRLENIKFGKRVTWR
jgi:superfamily II DNA or RNA helicase